MREDRLSEEERYRCRYWNQYQTSASNQYLWGLLGPLLLKPFRTRESGDKYLNKRGVNYSVSKVGAAIRERNKNGDNSVNGAAKD